MEVADVLHALGANFLDKHPWLCVRQRTVLRALTRCRTAALGGHVDSTRNMSASARAGRESAPWNVRHGSHQVQGKAEGLFLPASPP